MTDRDINDRRDGAAIPPTVRALLAVTAAALALVASAPPASAAPPERLSHQGRLTDADGPVDGDVEMEFRIYATAEGGAALWTESVEVEVDDGWYSVLLGGTTPGLAALFVDSDTLWLEQVIDGGAPLSPRQRLAAVPYALSADTATNVRGGLVDADEVQIGGQTVIDGAGAWTGAPGSLGWNALGGMSCASGDRPVWSGSMWDCGPVSWAEIDAVPTELLDGDQDALGALSCADGEGARMEAGTWVCAGPEVEPAWVMGDTASAGQVLTWGAGGAEWQEPDAGSGCTLTTVSPSLAELDCGTGSVRLRTRPVVVALAASASGTTACGIDSGGELLCWGAYSRLMEPLPSGPFVDLAVGGGPGVCGIRTDGTLGCSGLYTAINTPPPGSYSSVHLGPSFGIGLTIGGTVVPWGDSLALAGYGLSSPPSGLFSAFDVQDIGQLRACGVTLGGSLTCWGGQSCATWTQPPIGSTFTDIVARGIGFCALSGVGATSCWSACASEPTFNVGPFPTFSSLLPAISSSYEVCGIDASGAVTCVSPSGLTRSANGPYATFHGDWGSYIAIRSDTGLIETSGQLEDAP